MFSSIKQHVSEYASKFFICFREGYTRDVVKKDLIAGVTVGIVAIPLAMAFAIASGVGPERGLFTAIVAGFLISFLGGSRVQIGGPTGAFVAIVWGVVQRQGYEGLVYATLLAGMVLILSGIFRLGSLIKFIPYPLVIGFTTGIAFFIFTSQVKDFLGLHTDALPGDMVGKWKTIFHALPSFDPVTFIVSSSVLIAMALIRRFAPKIPWGISAIVFATVLVTIFEIPVATIKSRFGELPHFLPPPSLPSFSWSFAKLQEIIPDAMTIAFLAGVESLLSAVIADGMTGRRHKSNSELCAQGIANIASVICGGIPATGAIARTATNIKSGGLTPLSGMVHALTILLILMVGTSIVSLIPIPALSALLILVAWNMSELHHFRRLFKAPAGDVFIMLTAFFLTVFVDLTVAVGVGMVFASFLFLKRMASLSKVAPASLSENDVELLEQKDRDAIFRKQVPPEVDVYEIDGPFFFGAADSLKNILSHLERTPAVCIVRMRKVPVIDASGMHALKELYHKCSKQGTVLLLSGVKDQPLESVRKYGLAEEIGEENILPHIDAALERARQIIEMNKRVF